MEQKTKSGFSLYINSSENVKHAVRVQRRKMKYRKALLIALVIVWIFGLFAYRYRTYRTMTIEKILTKDMANCAGSFAYKSGTICYSEDGMSFLDKDGNEEWNRTYSIKNPLVSYRGNYLAVASKSGNDVVLLTQSGQMKQFNVSYPIIDIEVASQGVVALLLQGEDGNYIELYEGGRKKLVSIKTAPDDNGYPIDIALSSDGQNLAVSYLIVDGVKTKSRVAFYNFGNEGKEKDDQMIGSFDFNDTIIPKISYMGDSRLCAIGDHQVIMFKAGRNPSKKREVTLDKIVKSVAVSDRYMVLVLEDKEKLTKKGQYEMEVYNRSGNKIMSKEFSSEYNKIAIGKREVLFIGNYHYAIFNFAGHRMFRKNFKRRVLDIAPTGKARKYLISYEDEMDLISLR